MSSKAQAAQLLHTVTAKNGSSTFARKNSNPKHKLPSADVQNIHEQVLQAQ